MQATFGRHDTQRALDGGINRRPRTRVRSWTGRAANSLSTDSSVPTFVTAGTRRTRVSEMRLHSRTGVRWPQRSGTRPAIRTPERTYGEQPRIRHRMSG